MLPSKKTFCILPFTTMSNTNSGEYRVCCESFGFEKSIQDTTALEVWNSEYYKKLRLDLISGIQHTNCDACWKLESNDGYSMRKNENRKYSESDINQLLSNMNSDGELSILPELFDFKLGNTCNLKCIMCCQLSSSLHEVEVKQWQKDNIKLPQLLDFIELKFKDENQQYRIDKEHCDLIIDNLKSILPGLKVLRLVGGEPLINPFTFEIINRIIELGYASSLELDIITNLSELKDDLVDKLSKFKSVRLTVSYDHIDDIKFNFIRYPADYKKFKSNFNKLILNENINLEISTTFSIFNIFDIEAIFEIFEEFANKRNKLFISFNYVVEPKYFSIKYLEDSQKYQIINLVNALLENNKDYTILKNDNLLNYLNGIDKFLFGPVEDFASVVKERTRVLDLYDKTRKTSYKKLYSFIKEYA